MAKCDSTDYCLEDRKTNNRHGSSLSPIDDRQRVNASLKIINLINEHAEAHNFEMWSNGMLGSATMLHLLVVGELLGGV